MQNRLNIMYKIGVFLILSFFFYQLKAQAVYPPFLSVDSQWADSLIAGMTLEEKIGQLIMVTSERIEGNEERIHDWIRNEKVGGVLFLKSSPFELASMANRFQASSRVPLYIALDAENGLSFRLDSVVRYPYAMSLGALAADTLIYQMGREVGQQCRALGVNLNFAPVADVNVNPYNPVINYRSFGENPHKVAAKSWELARGLQDEQILVSAKHFPGHGDTAYDSHVTLPIIKRNKTALDSIDLLPFKHLIGEGINGIMSAHIALPEVDTSLRPATLSSEIMTKILRDEMGFKGLVFSDGMNMKGITSHFREGEAAVEALKAGVDVVEFVLQPDVVISAVKEACRNGELSEELIHEKCHKVLMSKKWLGLDHYEPTILDGLSGKINSSQYALTARYLYEHAVTVLNNDGELLPLQRLDTLNIATVAIGSDVETTFQHYLENYIELDHFTLGTDASEDEMKALLKQLNNYDLLIAGVHGTRLSASNSYGVLSLHREMVRELSKRKTIFSFFTNPYALKYFDGIEDAAALIVTYGSAYASQTYAAQLIFGAIGSDASLPVSINTEYREGDGVEVKKNGRLKYTIPAEVGYNEERLKTLVDSLATYGIREKIFPGCQVLLAKEGKVFFHRCYGYHTYDSVRVLKTDDIYDWASLTKITGPLPLIMKLTEEQRIDLDAPYSRYWPDFLNTNKEKITFREILAHQAGLRPWIPFYLEVYKANNKVRRSIMRDKPSVSFPLRISPNYYIHQNYKHKIYSEIRESELLSKKEYVYSGLAFYSMPDLIGRLVEGDYEQYLQQRFLRPLGAGTVCYNPYRYFSQNRFVPTEDDLYFRKDVLRGFVHDEGAAMMGGVSGNAGLFGSTNDLAKIMQFYLQKGVYGDHRYLLPQTIELFTCIQYPDNDNRRGLGFDKPYIDNSEKDLKDAYPAPETSTASFGHSGYTGTFAWADPENQLLFIFMSNRVYPSRNNSKLFDLNFRPELQQAIYQLEGSFSYSNY